MSQTTEKPQQAAPQRARWLLWCGAVLVVLSFVFYACLLLVPFVPFAPSGKVVVGVVLVVLGEASFWIGGLILGSTVVARYRRFLNPRTWFRRTA